MIHIMIQFCARNIKWKATKIVKIQWCTGRYGTKRWKKHSNIFIFMCTKKIQRPMRYLSINTQKSATNKPFLYELQAAKWIGDGPDAAVLIHRLKREREKRNEFKLRKGQTDQFNLFSLYVFFSLSLLPLSIFRQKLFIINQFIIYRSRFCLSAFTYALFCFNSGR